MSGPNLCSNVASQIDELGRHFRALGIRVLLHDHA